ncbi:hypothetical protein [Paenibacillus sonchi]|nr:hypothetical protein [Paenibacillus sonchi]
MQGTAISINRHTETNKRLLLSFNWTAAAVLIFTDKLAGGFMWTKLSPG